MGVVELTAHLKLDCNISDERVVATVVKPDGTEFVKMMCRNCGKIWVDVYQDEGLMIA